MKDYLILLLVVLSCFHASVVDGLKGGLHRNNRRAKNLAAEKIPCTDNCNSPMDTNVDETTEPLKAPSVGSVENTADSNNINNLIQEKLMESFNSFLQTNSQAQSKVEPRDGGSAAVDVYSTPIVPPLPSLSGCERGPDGHTLVRTVT